MTPRGVNPGEDWRVADFRLPPPEVPSPSLQLPASSFLDNLYFLSLSLSLASFASLSWLCTDSRWKTAVSYWT